jgi:hypothetical protein
MSYLQQVLDEIEAEAAKKSRLACEGAAAIEFSFSLRDRLIKDEGFDPMMSLHYFGDALEVTMHAMAHEEDMFRVALAGLDIEASESAGYQQIAPGVSLMFKNCAQWYPMREAA